MRFDQRLVLGTLLRRYKRFLADVRLADGRCLTAHVANTGSMLGCADPGSRVALSHHPDAGRKLPWSWELVEVGGSWVVVNTARPNAVVAEAVAAGRIGPLRGYEGMRREVGFGERSRVDLLLESAGRPPCYVEVKNVTLRDGRRALFPDAVSERGLKHLRELEAMVRQGARGVMLFLVNRSDCGSMGPADAIHPAYGESLRWVAARGVELLAYRTRPTLDGIEVDRKIPIHL
jgi:sugar fermentation stimulation protein A